MPPLLFEKYLVGPLPPGFIYERAKSAITRSVAVEPAYEVRPLTPVALGLRFRVSNSDRIHSRHGTQSASMNATMSAEAARAPAFMSSYEVAALHGSILRDGRMLLSSGGKRATRSAVSGTMNSSGPSKSCAASAAIVALRLSPTRSP